MSNSTISDNKHDKSTLKDRLYNKVKNKYNKVKSRVSNVISSVTPFHITLASAVCFLYSSLYVISSDGDRIERLERIVGELENTLDEYEAVSERLLSMGDPFIIRNFEHNGNTITIEIPSMAYIAYRFGNHEVNQLSDYSAFITSNDRYVSQLTQIILRDINPPDERAHAVLTFVHGNFPYGYDPMSPEGNMFNYVKTPLETVVESNGDCEDLSLLTATLMKIAGLDVVLLYFENKELHLAHIAVGISGNFDGVNYEFNGRNYFYVESTNSYDIGVVPVNIPTLFEGVSPTIIPLE